MSGAPSGTLPFLCMQLLEGVMYWKVSLTSWPYFLPLTYIVENFILMSLLSVPDWMSFHLSASSKESRCRSSLLRSGLIVMPLGVWPLLERIVETSTARFNFTSTGRERVESFLYLPSRKQSRTEYELTSLFKVDSILRHSSKSVLCLWYLEVFWGHSLIPCMTTLNLRSPGKIPLGKADPEAGLTGKWAVPLVTDVFASLMNDELAGGWPLTDSLPCNAAISLCCLSLVEF